MRSYDCIRFRNLTYACFAQSLEGRLLSLAQSEVRLQKLITLATPALSGLKARAAPVSQAVTSVLASAPTASLPVAATVPVVASASSISTTSAHASAAKGSCDDAVPIVHKVSASAALAAAVAASKGAGSGSTGIQAHPMNRLPGSEETVDALTSGLNIRKAK